MMEAWQILQGFVRDQMEEAKGSISSVAGAINDARNTQDELKYVLEEPDLDEAKRLIDELEDYLSDAGAYLSNLWSGIDEAVEAIWAQIHNDHDGDVG